MIREILTDKLLLSMPSDPVKPDEDINTLIKDMIHTAELWRNSKTGCVGLAANQVGTLRRVILVWTGASFEVMVNPTWQERDGKVACQHEQCLSRPSVNVKVKRHKRIEAEWLTPTGSPKKQKFAHFTARIIQHEVDHLNGIFINN